MLLDFSKPLVLISSLLLKNQGLFIVTNTKIPIYKDEPRLMTDSQVQTVFDRFGGMNRFHDLVRSLGYKVRKARMRAWLYPMTVKYGTGGIFPHDIWPTIFTLAIIEGVVLDKRCLQAHVYNTKTLITTNKRAIIQRIRQRELALQDEINYELLKQELMYEMLK